MAFKKRFKYKNNEKINFIKVILKFECLVYQKSSYYILVDPFRLKQIQKVYL